MRRTVYSWCLILESTFSCTDGPSLCLPACTKTDPSYGLKIIFQLILSPFTKLSIMSHVLNEFEHFSPNAGDGASENSGEAMGCVCKGYVKFEGENNSAII